MLDGFDQQPDGAYIIDNVKRAFTNPKKQKFVESFRRTIRYVDRPHPLGLYVGRVPIVRIDPDRLARVVERIVKALYFHERGERLTDDCKVTARWASSFRYDIGKGGQSYRSLRDYVLSRSHKIIGGDAFSYWFSFGDEFKDSGDNFSVWYFRFYGRFSVLSITDSRKESSLKAS
jgi:hypothetical protein